MEIIGNRRHLDLISPGRRLYDLEAWHTTPLDPLAGFEKIMGRMPPLDTQDCERDNPLRAGSWGHRRH